MWLYYFLDILSTISEAFVVLVITECFCKVPPVSQKYKQNHFDWRFCGVRDLFDNFYGFEGFENVCGAICNHCLNQAVLSDFIP